MEKWLMKGQPEQGYLLFVRYDLVHKVEGFEAQQDDT
jgi:hypothetical protein